ncbi:hypothetical protein A3A54_01755 [Candidatus Curtissbacteria bacterium RIFCSPLOWO2_01_FULL_39_62]|uniref:Uncharacterized protein n=2 Tax=Candidatus Curtissiibacteriota TaxID=1752717 RepID=A0A1F5G9E9_9BACT|nr:MAG: hypothetical protein A2775_02435 [Candidatus Curtissbacteria bacterium RIFCSPHIGHO2_01_FULL_39_57]OGD88469.1 MAG: hypothetical protein A3D04_00985 [Candidatus Curtissbacteria bacterium RIFCSPHIGHO2_02_FULL_40_16b]OGD90885.1 MAG: hypothetical protein A3E11_02750 [Candidatus Curtissbacteria bacterium RIFCSPHIGHO2_12_FULL_38_37]OGE00331.1 MAG: hypothetical protein A3J17_01510 [Candidatus Curtissbacteria bacterium RIFCSPLOWO2_02_FULL_40_11]OGE00820.1 MAG: hypothetical protein A3A54_01755 [C
MRDLAKQTYQSASSRSSKILIPQSVVRIVLLLILVLVVLFIVKKVIDAGGIVGSSITLRDAPKGLTPVEAPGVVDVTGDALSLTVQDATFTNVSGENATATATRRFGDGSYNMSVSATLPDPQGNKYQVWIVGGGQQFLAGDMSGSAKNWGIVFNDVDDYSNLNGVWITREITNNDNRPELHILEGVFK